jgi:hypothetical protein
MLTYGQGGFNLQAMDQQLVDVGYDNPAANILDSGSPMSPIALPTAGVATTASTDHPANYNYSIVDYLNSKGLPSSYSARKDIAKILNIPDYNRTDVQNMKMLQTLISNPNILQTIISNKPKGSNSTSKAINNIRKKAEAQGAIVGGGGSRSAGIIAPPIVNQPPVADTSKPTVINVDSLGRPILDSNVVKIDTPKINIPNLYDFRDTGNGGGGTRPENKLKPSASGSSNVVKVLKGLGAGVTVGAGLTYLYGRMTAPQRVQTIIETLSKDPSFVQASDNLKNQMLEKATSDIEAVYQSYKKMPKEQKAILDNLDAMEIDGYYPGQDIGDPVARAEAMFANDEANLERRLESQFRSQEAEAMNAEADLENRLNSQYADQQAAEANAEANLERDITNRVALERSGVKPTRAKTIVRNQASTQNMLDEAAAEEAAYQNFIKSKMVKTPAKGGSSLAQRLRQGIKNKMPVGRPSTEAPRVEIKGEAPKLPSRLGQQAGKFLRGFIKEIGKREYGGAYVPDYAMAYGGMYAAGGQEDYCTDPMTGQPIDCETLRMREMNRSYQNRANMRDMNSSNPSYRMNPNTGRIDTGGVRMNPYHEQIHSQDNPYLRGGRAVWSNDPERLRNSVTPIPTRWPSLRPGENPLQQLRMRQPIPAGMYGGGMAQGGQMPQWLAQRRFAAAGNQDQMSSYGYQQGGVVEVDEANLPQFLQQLKQGGYEFEIMR